MFEMCLTCACQMFQFHGVDIYFNVCWLLLYMRHHICMACCPHCFACCPCMLYFASHHINACCFVMFMYYVHCLLAQPIIRARYHHPHAVILPDLRHPPIVLVVCRFVLLAARSISSYYDRGYNASLKPCVPPRCCMLVSYAVRMFDPS